MAGKSFHSTPRHFYRNVVLTYNGEECLIWPFGRGKTGYPMLWDDGQMQYVHLLLCKEVNGPPPTPDHDAAHSCGKGKQGCVTKRHLDWKTRIENEADKLEHGTHNRGARHGLSILTDDDVRQIRTLRGYLPQAEIGQMFGVSRVAVCQIHTRQRWGWLD